MNRKQQKIFVAVNTVPTLANVEFSDMEKLTVGLGGEIIEGSGSRMAFVLNDQKLFAHRPHPAKEAKKYQVEAFREFLTKAGFKYE